MDKANSTLEELRRMLGEDALKQILDAYQDSLTEFEIFLNNIRADSAEIKKEAHKMKSPSLSVGELIIAGFCQRIELAGVMTEKDRTTGIAKVSEIRDRLKTYAESL